jgi:hypothetical protein
MGKKDVLTMRSSIKAKVSLSGLGLDVRARGHKRDNPHDASSAKGPEYPKAQGKMYNFVQGLGSVG